MSVDIVCECGAAEKDLELISESEDGESAIYHCLRCGAYFVDDV